MRARTLTIRLIEKRLFLALFSALFVLGALYSYFLVSSIVNVVIREETEHQIAILNSKLSDMEFSYIERQNGIDISLAQSLGFVGVKEKQFVTRRSALSQSLTLDSVQ